MLQFLDFVQNNAGKVFGTISISGAGIISGFSWITNETRPTVDSLFYVSLTCFSLTFILLSRLPVTEKFNPNVFQEPCNQYSLILFVLYGCVKVTSSLF